MQSSNPMQQYVCELLTNNLSQKYHYHNFDHALEVQHQVAEIGAAMGCTQQELRLLDIAALWHDTGFIISHISHEEQSCILAKEHLPTFGISEAEIRTICSLIMATKMPTSPTNLLEQIMADADVGYLGTTAVAEWSDKLFEELKELNNSLTKEEWNNTQIEFLRSHHFYTSYCQLYKQPVKEAFLKSLVSA